MNKEQIEEMAKIIHDSVDKNKPCPDEEYGGFSCLGCDYIDKGYCQHDMERAMGLYNAGYRKQSEGEWLPSPDGIQPIRCSKCNMPAPFVAGENEFGDFEICRYPSRYCHECGAKMFIRMTHTCAHIIPNLIPTIEEMKGGAE